MIAIQHTKLYLASLLCFSFVGAISAHDTVVTCQLTFRDNIDEEDSCGCSPHELDYYQHDRIANAAPHITAPEEHEQLVIQRYGNYLVIYTLTQSFYDGSWEYVDAVKLYNLSTQSWVFLTLTEAYSLTHQLPPMPPR